MDINEKIFLLCFILFSISPLSAEPRPCKMNHFIPENLYLPSSLNAPINLRFIGDCIAMPDASSVIEQMRLNSISVVPTIVGTKTPTVDVLNVNNMPVFFGTPFYLAYNDPNLIVDYVPYPISVVINATGVPTSTGKIIFNFYGYGLPYASNSITPGIRTTTINYSIIQPCTVSIPSTVNLGKVLASSLPSINSVSSNTSFEISLQGCGKIGLVLPKVGISFAGEVNGINNTQLKIREGIGLASGVAIQVLYNGDPVNFDGTSLSIATNVDISSIVNIPLVARYIRTGNITGGAANAYAQINVQYN